MSSGCAARYGVQRYLMDAVPGSTIGLNFFEVERAVKLGGAPRLTEASFSKPVRSELEPEPIASRWNRSHGTGFSGSNEDCPKRGVCHVVDQHSNGVEGRSVGNSQATQSATIPSAQFSARPWANLRLALTWGQHGLHGCGRTRDRRSFGAGTHA